MNIAVTITEIFVRHLFSR